MKLFLLFFICINSYSAVPTMEGLFRNSNSSTIDKEVVVILLKTSVNRIIPGASEIPSTLNKKVKYYKYILENKKNGGVIIARYDEASMKLESLENVSIYENFEEAIKLETISSKQIIGSMMLMYGKNSSNGFLSYFKSINNEFMSNQEVLNIEKKDLLEKYKEYLIRKKDYERKKKNEERLMLVGKSIQTDSLETTDDSLLVSPMIPLEDEEKVKVQELISASMYRYSPKIKLMKEANKFFWTINLDNIIAKFSNEEHQLKYIKVTKNGNYEILTDNFVTFSGVYSIPKSFILKSDNYLMNFDIVNFYTIKKGKKDFSTRIDDYKKYKINLETKLNVSNKEESPIISIMGDEAVPMEQPVNFSEILL